MSAPAVRIAEGEGAFVAFDKGVLEVVSPAPFAPGAPLALEVPLPEPELPESLRRGPEVRFDAVVVPHEDGRWVLVPTLQHTIFVGRDEPLEETVARELGRHLRAEGDARDLRDPLELARPAARLAAQEAELERARLAAVAPAAHLGVLLLLLPLVQPLELGLEHGVLLVELAQRHLQRGRLAQLHLPLHLALVLDPLRLTPGRGSG